METDGYDAEGWLYTTQWVVSNEQRRSPVEMLEVRIHGATLAIRFGSRRDALRRNSHVERIGRNWMDYIGGLAGLAQISKSGKAINIDLVCGDPVYCIARICEGCS